MSIYKSSPPKKAPPRHGPTRYGGVFFLSMGSEPHTAITLTGGVFFTFLQILPPPLRTKRPLSAVFSTKIITFTWNNSTSSPSYIIIYSSRKQNDSTPFYGNDYNKLDKEYQLVLATAITENNVSNYRIQQLLGRNPLEAGKLLYYLVDKGMLISSNKGRWTSYSINSEYCQGVKKSRSKSQGVREQKKQKIRETLITFCQEPRTLQEIADQLGFADRNRMKRVYIDPILGELLEMTSSKSKNAPTQKYQTKQTDKNI